MTITFQKAARRAVKLKIGIDGPSGSGKTMGALALAHGITNGGRIAVGDSENGSAALYADRFAFDTVSIPDADPATYRAVIDAAVAGGYDALVIDSLSHAWLYVLAQKEDHDRLNPRSNSWTNWRLFAPKWEGLMQHLLQAPIHVIATMRSKQAYEQVEQNGKKQVLKLGLQPQVRDGAEYEFGLVFSVNMVHAAEASKDRTRLFTDRFVNLCDPKLHAELVTWMNAGGVEAPERSDHATAARESHGTPEPAASPASVAASTAPLLASDEQVAQIRDLAADVSISAETRANVEQLLARGLTPRRADESIRRLQKLIVDAQLAAAGRVENGELPLTGGRQIGPPNAVQAGR